MITSKQIAALRCLQEIDRDAGNFLLCQHIVRPNGQTIYESIQSAVANGQRLLPDPHLEARITTPQGLAKRLLP